VSLPRLLLDGGSPESPRFEKTFLQGVSVSLFDKRAIQEHLLRRTEDGRREEVAFQRRLQALADSAERVRSAPTRAVREEEINRMRADMLLSEMRLLRLKAKKFSRADYFLVGMPRPIAQTVTDARGKFVLTVPRGGSHAIVAYISFWEAYMSHRYAWVISVPADRERGGELDLTEVTLTSGNSPLSLIHTERDIEPTL